MNFIIICNMFYRYLRIIRANAQADYRVRHLYGDTEICCPYMYMYIYVYTDHINLLRDEVQCIFF